MEYFEVIPCEELCAYINCFWIMKSDASKEISNTSERLFADGSLEVVFHFKERMTIESFDGEQTVEQEDVLVGQITKPYFIYPPKEYQMIGIRFFPFSAHLFFDVPIAEINDTAINLDIVWGSAFFELKSKLFDAKPIADAIPIIESFLLNKVRDKSFKNADHFLAYSCKQIMLSKGLYPISELAKELGISNRHLQKIFHKHTGIGPKFFSKIIRFQNCFGAFKKKGYTSLTSLAYECGYFDQAHFIRDFRSFTGTIPSQFFKESHLIAAPFTDPDNRSYLYNY